ncbi:unnamed protein product [Phyllotreta striolata]|uniref:ditrans,polycis-polyprenyl diphosphate synthase [(2E,6E)-farnesyldiphosphate specific] n=1 Tax=Phyllotreta striolata TaxID=444603 RepID=A0A9N9TIX2_PHYSR|nr:unnamed protein product [Phyllotreta striolata]
MESTHFYRVLYVLVHAIYTIVEVIWNATLWIVREFELIHSRYKNVRKRLFTLSKTPKHLTVIVGHDDCSLRDLTNLIIWCIAVEIPYISFYDFKGKLKKEEERFRSMVESQKHSTDHIVWHRTAGTYKNGFVGRKIHVKILTEEDGRENIVNLTKELAVDRDRANGISIESINGWLLERFEFPDPDMGLVCGGRLHILNYPPWQLRLTEFFRLNDLSNITFSSFLDYLEMFSKCEQRVGT